MKSSLFEIWACLSLVVSGVVLFLFVNILLVGKVCFYENIKLILAVEYLLAVFVFAISLYIFYLLMRGYKIKFERN